jgi:hypothetical protein
VTAVLQQPVLLLLAATCGLGIFLLVAGSALQRSPTDLVTRLRRLDPDSWWEEPNVPRRSTAFGGPLSEDASRLVGRVFGYVGLIAPADLARSLAHAGSDMTMHEFYFEKILTALGLEAVLVVADFGFERFGLTQVGVWPLWLWLGVGVLGFVMPDLVVRRRASVHQTRLRAELPTLVDLLAVAVSTGRGRCALMQTPQPLRCAAPGPWRRLVRLCASRSTLRRALFAIDSGRGAVDAPP